MRAAATEEAAPLDWSSVRAVLFDIDGVLRRGDAVQPAAAELHRFLVRRGTAVACVTNDSTHTPDQHADRLARLGIEVAPQHVITSALAARRHLERVAPAGARLLVTGMVGLRQALLADGLFEEVEHDPDYVVVGLDLAFGYARGRACARALLGGAAFIGTNADRTRPSERGLEPEAGALLGFLEAATGVAPHVVGKPGPLMFELALERLGVAPEQALVVGDNLHTDIAGARDAGLASVLVLNGVTSPAELGTNGIEATWAVPGLANVLDAWRRA